MQRARPVAALYVVSVVVFALIAHQHKFPNLFPDEMLYGKLSQGFAAGDGLSWRGSGWGLPPLWPIVLSSAWHFGSIPDGYGVARGLTAALASTVVIPVWLLGRVFVGPRLALIPALLSVAGAWMVVTSYLVSENLAYPLATTSLACTVMAVRDTRTRWLAASFGLGVVAALARTQMLALPVILLLALLIDIARQPTGARRARFDARPRLLWIGLALVVAAGLLAFVLNPNLTNYDVLGHHAGIGEVAGTAGRHAASSIVMLAFIPVAAVVALMARSTNWRDERVGPLLVTISAAVVVLYPLLGRFEAWATHGNPVDRYAMYLAPLFLVAMMLAPGRVGPRAAVLSAVAVVVALFAVPITNNYIEQPALYGTQKRLFELGVFDQHLRLALVLAALPVTVGGMLLLTRVRGVAAATALIAALMVMQGWTSQHAEIQLEKRVASTTLADPPDWVDRKTDGPVALLAVDKDEPLRRNTDLYTDFFNRNVKYLFAAGASGSGACDVRFGSHGLLRRQGGACPAWPRDYVLLAGPTRATFYGQKLVARADDKALVRLPAGPPRALSLVRSSEVVLHLDEPARVRLRFAHGTNTYKLAPGDHRLQVRHLSALRAAVVTSAGRRTRIY